MALINFSNIDFEKSINKMNKNIHFNGSDIQIVNYLSASDKYDFIMITLQKAYENGIYNPFKLNMYFNLHIVYMYTNIIFDSDVRADENTLFDILNRSGLIDAVKAEIDQKELETLWNFINETGTLLFNIQGSFLHTLSNLAQELPGKIEAATATLKNLNPDLLSNLFNNIRPIITEEKR